MNFFFLTYVFFSSATTRESSSLQDIKLETSSKASTSVTTYLDIPLSRPTSDPKILLAFKSRVKYLKTVSIVRFVILIPFILIIIFLIVHNALYNIKIVPNLGFSGVVSEHSNLFATMLVCYLLAVVLCFVVLKFNNYPLNVFAIKSYAFYYMSKNMNKVLDC